MSNEHAPDFAEPAGDVVPGTVRLMSDEPEEPGLCRRVEAQLRRRPWLIPAVLMTAVALLVVSRRP